MVAEWPDLAVSSKSGSYGVTHVPTPVVAPDPDLLVHRDRDLVEIVYGACVPEDRVGVLHAEWIRSGGWLTGSR